MVHLIHSALMVPADVADDDVAVGGVGEPVECQPCPVVVPRSERSASMQLPAVWAGRQFKSRE